MVAGGAGLARSLLSLAGDQDPLVPLAGLHKIDRELKRVHAEDGAPDAWRLVLEPCGHEETPRMREEITAFLKKFVS